MAIDFSVAIRSAVAAIGSDYTYVPRNGSSATVRGILDRSPATQQRTNGAYEFKTALDYLPADPQKGDVIREGEVEYVVGEVGPDAVNLNAGKVVLPVRKRQS